MVKISDPGAGDEYGIEDIPALVYFEDGVPEIFTGLSHFYFLVYPFWIFSKLLLSLIDTDQYLLLKVLETVLLF
jgi:hypothetical protein